MKAVKKPATDSTKFKFFNLHTNEKIKTRSKMVRSTIGKSNSSNDLKIGKFIPDKVTKLR
jgi:hypothetical protein